MSKKKKTVKLYANTDSWKKFKKLNPEWAIEDSFVVSDYDDIIELYYEFEPDHDKIHHFFDIEPPNGKYRLLEVRVEEFLKFLEKNGYVRSKDDGWIIPKSKKVTKTKPKKVSKPSHVGETTTTIDSIPGHDIKVGDTITICKNGEDIKCIVKRLFHHNKLNRYEARVYCKETNKHYFNKL